MSADALLAAAGLALETAADRQKAEWHAAHPLRPDSAATEPPVCTVGAWAWSRHPNLFGEACFHCGLYALVAAVTPPVVAAAPLATVLTVAWLPTGPLRTLEREKSAVFAGHPAYLKYAMRTSPFIPMPSNLYVWAWQSCPKFCEQACCAGV